MKKYITLTSILICLILSGISVYHHQNNGIALAKENRTEARNQSLEKDMDVFMKDLRMTFSEKNYNNRDISIGIRASPHEIITIVIDGTQQYVDKVEGDIKNTVQKLAQNTIFKDFPVRVVRVRKGRPDTKYTPEMSALVSKVTLKIQENLESKYEEMENVVVEKKNHKLIINVYTSLPKKHSPSNIRGKEIEKTVRKTLDQMKVKSNLMSHNETLDLNVYNKNKKKINSTPSE
ncbi:hypothetical protein [Pseudalkalibacillus decolorationis]|uniref:hypothetical protein n=1 Tax=Pseudalkalibacillus decolorationis TaxID=163879 RepID=UPI002148341A|nr:hypothetical protein [Pseudalkalibacillus decolorationis]